MNNISKQTFCSTWNISPESPLLNATVPGGCLGGVPESSAPHSIQLDYVDFDIHIARYCYVTSRIQSLWPLRSSNRLSIRFLVARARYSLIMLSLMGACYD